MTRKVEWEFGSTRGITPKSDQSQFQVQAIDEIAREGNLGLVSVGNPSLGIYKVVESDRFKRAYKERRRRRQERQQRAGPYRPFASWQRKFSLVCSGISARQERQSVGITAFDKKWYAEKCIFKRKRTPVANS
mmetsp:Transcript_28126/g.43892  ORF Transcript_28126/g.43892 Transcript_28126/m.43892 type:complete len:133 (+) Transcript_28126:414-812(+)